jgi:hypothetical protein
MNLVLWAVQIILAIKMVATAYSHGVRRDQPKMRAGIARMGAPARSILVLVAVGSVLLAIGLVLPLAAAVPAWIVPGTAAVLAAGMLLSILLHRACRENPNLLPGIVLCVLAAVVAAGRSLFPIS